MASKIVEEYGDQRAAEAFKQGEQKKADKRSDGQDVATDRAAEQAAEQRHQKLEAAEIQSREQCVPHFQAAHGQALADRDGEGVHAQAHADQENDSRQEHLQNLRRAAAGFGAPGAQRISDGYSRAA